MRDGRGSYILLIELPEQQSILVGKLNSITFPKGFYAYVGSAMGGFKARIGYHLRRKKNSRWHIDYLLERAKVLEIILCETEERVECILAQSMARQFRPISGFGSSDCKCTSHLYFGKEKDRLEAEATKAINQAGFTCEILRPGESMGDLESPWG